MSSPLSLQLEKTRGRRKSFVRKRRYMAAKDLLEDAVQAADRIKVSEAEERQRLNDIEERRLGIAKDFALKKVHQEVTAELRDIERRWDEKEVHLKETQNQQLQTFNQLTMRHAMNRPVVLSAYVRQLQVSEAKLADMQMYDEADMVRRKIQRREEEERIKAQEEHLSNARATIERRKALQEESARFFQIKMKNEIALAKFRAAEEEKRLHLLFDHVERDLEHAHKIKGILNPQVLAVAKGTKHRKASPLTSADTRGTYYFHRVHGNRFEVPSLCDLYGDRLDPEKRELSGAEPQTAPSSA